MNEIIERFKHLGFSEKAVTVYLHLAESQRATVQEISKATKINRTTVYATIEKLCDEGLISRVENTKYFIANDPSSLFAMVIKEKAEVSRKETQVKQLMDLIMPHFHPKLQYFDGEDNVRGLLNSYIDIWFKSMQEYDDTLWGYQDHTFVEQYHDWLTQYWKKRNPKHCIRLFSNECELEKKLATEIENRQIMAAPSSMQLGSTIWINGDYVTMIMTQRDPHYAIQIKDTVFAADLRSMFQMFWNLYSQEKS